MLSDRDRATVSILHACAIAGVSRRTIYNWLNAHKIEFVRTPTGRVRIFRDTLLVPAGTPTRHVNNAPARFR